MAELGTTPGPKGLQAASVKANELRLRSDHGGPASRPGLLFSTAELLEATMAFNPGHLKRQKEAKRAEKQREKDARPEGAEGDVDPDIAGIVPGPQPKPEE